MSKKILTVLVPLAMMGALMAAPAVVRATTLQTKEKALGVGATLKLQGTNLSAETEEESGEKGKALKCSHVEFEGKLTSNGSSTVESDISSSTYTGCTFGGTGTDLDDNSTPAEPWRLRLQQPDTKGNSIGHIFPTAAGKIIQLTQQPQIFGISVTTCDYWAAGIQVLVQPNFEGHILGGQVTRQSGGPYCSLYGSYNVQLTGIGNGDPVTLDMT